MENLIEVLDLESAEYEKLLELSMKKTPVIIAGDTEGLAKITDEEQDGVSRISRLEQGRVNKLDHKRQEIYADIANVINKDVKTLKLTDLIAMLAPREAEQQKLARVHDRLKNAVYEMKRVNGQNQILIENALEMVEFDMNMLQAMKAAPETADYDKGAMNTGYHMGMGAGGFDARQ